MYVFILLLCRIWRELISWHNIPLIQPKKGYNGSVLHRLQCWTTLLWHQYNFSQITRFEEGLIKSYLSWLQSYVSLLHDIVPYVIYDILCWETLAVVNVFLVIGSHFRLAQNSTDPTQEGYWLVLHRLHNIVLAPITIFCRKLHRSCNFRRRLINSYMSWSVTVLESSLVHGHSQFLAFGHLKIYVLWLCHVILSKLISRHNILWSNSEG